LAQIGSAVILNVHDDENVAIPSLLGEGARPEAAVERGHSREQH